MNLKNTGNFFLWFGVAIILISLIYMIVNLADADNIIYKWMVVMVTGVSSAFWGAISLFIQKKRVQM